MIGGFTYKGRVMSTEKIAYIRDMARELRQLAKSDDCSVLAHIFGIAELEAIELIVKGEGVEPLAVQDGRPRKRRLSHAEADQQPSP
jgi:hypothetical protein